MFPSNQRISQSDQKIPLSPDEFSVGAHGNPDYIRDAQGKIMSADQLANMIRANPKYKNGMPVKLNSCSTGGVPKGKANFAQQLANQLGAPVTAPDVPLNIRTNGSTHLSTDAGTWQTFSPISGNH